MNLNLEGKRALVCGSSQGMGLAIATELATSGANVTLFARNEESLKQALNKLPGEGHNYAVADFDNLKEVENVIDGLLLESEYQLLINNTGGPAPGKLYEVAFQDFEAPIRRHLYVSQLLTKKVLPGMQSAKYGRIVNIVSTSVKVPIDGLGVSNTIRGAMASWAKTMSNELGPMGITVNNILPGYINTSRIPAIIKSRSISQSKSVEEVERSMLDEIPIGRFGEPEEVANYTVFLCSPSGGYITGTSLRIDGGKTGSI